MFGKDSTTQTTAKLKERRNLIRNQNKNNTATSNPKMNLQKRECAIYKIETLIEAKQITKMVVQ